MHDRTPREQEICSSFSANLRKFRDLRGWTQSQLAELAGVARCTVNRYEQGHYRPHIDSAKLLAEALSVSLDTLCSTPKVKP